MELWGIGVDMEGCLQARQVLGRKLRHLEKEAYRLAGRTFSLYTASDIAIVLYEHLKLPIPEGYKKGKQHPSTDKHCLDLLRYRNFYYVFDGSPCRSENYLLQNLVNFWLSKNAGNLLQILCDFWIQVASDGV